MNINWRYLLFFLALALLLGLALLNPAAVLAYLVEPLARVAWLLVKLLLTVDQGVYWTLLIFAAFTFALRVAPGRAERASRPGDTNTPPEDRVAYWQALLRSAEDDPEARLALQNDLKRLGSAIDALAEGEPGEAISLPPVPAAGWRGTLARWQRPLLSQPILERRFPEGNSRPTTALEQSVDQALHSMETQLEINHDRNASPASNR